MVTEYVVTLKKYVSATAKKDANIRNFTEKAKILILEMCFYY